MHHRLLLPLIYFPQQYVGIAGKPGIEPQPTRNDGRKLSSSETGGSRSPRSEFRIGINQLIRVHFMQLFLLLS